MGVVSRLFFDRYVSSSSSGQYVVEHYWAEGRLWKIITGVYLPIR